MKRILQKSLFRLRTLLLLSVMFVVGSSAWAQDEIFEFSSSGTVTSTDGKVSVNIGYFYSAGATNVVNIMQGDDKNVVFTCNDNNMKIKKIVLTGYCEWTAPSASNFICVDTNGSEVGSFTKSTQSYTLTWTGSSSVVRMKDNGNNVDFGFTGAQIWLEDENAGGGDSGDQGDAGITFNLKNYAGGNTLKDPTNKASVYFQASGNENGINIWGSKLFTVNSLAIEPIERIVFKELQPFSTGKSTAIAISSGGGHFENGNNSSAPVTWIADNEVTSASFTNDGSADFYLGSIEVFLAAPRNYIDFSYTSTNAGSKGYYTLSSDVLTFDSPVTVTGVPNIDGVDATATANGNVVNISFDELNTPGEHTLVFPRGSLQIGDDYNNEIRVTYTLAQDPNKLFGTFFFSGVGLPYSRGGVNYNMASAYDFQVGDTFTANGVTFAFTNCPSGWFNNAQRFTVGQNTAFTIAAPEGYEITKIKFNTDDGQLKLNWVKGLTNVDDKNVVWVGNEESVGFSVLYDSKIQTVDVTCTKLVDVEYEVDIFKGTDSADDDWTVTIDGFDDAFKNSDTFTTGKKITVDDVHAPHHDGYHDAEVSIADWDGLMMITVTYDVFDPINYTVDFSDNAPVGASVTIDGQEFSADNDNWNVAKDLNYYSVTEVNAPAGWYADYDYDPFEHKFTFDFKEYNYYSVVVKGISDPAAGVTYHGDNYGAGQQIEAREELTEGSVTASNVTGYEGHVSLVGNTFTVTYSAPTYIEFVTSGISNTSVGEYRATSNGVTIVGYADSNYLEIWNRYYLTVTSATLPIDKVEFVAASSDFSLTTNSADNGSFVGYTWYADAASALQSVTFKSTGMSYNNYISKVRVYLRVPQLTTYNLAFTGEVPDGAKVTIEEQQYGAGTFDTYNENFTTTDIDATWTGYEADVTYNEETSTFTVTYYATTTYDVVVDPATLEGAAVIYGENEYAAGTGVITCRGTIDPETLSAKSVYGYVGAVSVSGTTITVTYTESDHFDIAESAISVVEGQYGMTNFKVNAPSGTSFSTLLQEYGNLITVNGEAKWTQLTRGYEGSFVTFTNPIGATEYGVFVVNFPADLLETADGKKNNAFTYTYTVEDPAAFTEPYYVNIYGYAFGQAAPDGASVNLVGFDDAISVSGQQYTAHPNVANFGDATTSLEGYDVTTSVNTEYKNVSVYFHKLAAVSSYTPATVENSLDDDAYEYGYNNLVLTFAAPFKEAVNIAATAELPAGMSVTLPDGVTRGQIYANSGSSELHIGLNGGNVVGDYSVEIAKNLFSFSYAQAVNGTITNDAFSQTWTLNAATTFRVNSWSGVSPRETVKSLGSFTVSAPDGMTFADPANANVTISVREGYEGEATNVITSVALVDGSMVFTFPTAYSSKGSIFVTVPAGAVSTTDGLTSKEFEASFNVDPFDYFDFVSTVPAADSNVTGPVNTITLTLPTGKTVKTVGESINVNWTPVAVTSHEINGDDVVLHLATALPYSQYNTINIPEAFIVTTDDALSNNLIYYNVYVNKVMFYASANVNGETTTTNSVRVEKFSSVEIYFDEESEYSYGVPTGVTLMKGEEPITIANGWNSAYNSVTYKYGSYYFIFDEISAPGTYTLHIPAGVFTSAEGNTNEEVNLDIEIPTPEYFAAMTVSPADRETRESLRTITLTAPDGVTFDDVKGLQGYPTVNESRDYMYGGYEFADDKKTVTININERTTDGAYTVTFPAGFVRSTDGKWSPELTATYTVSYPWFTLSKPQTGEVPAIENITIAAPADITFATPAANVTIVVNGVNTQVDASLNGEGNIVLAYRATAANRYDISIPASTFTSTNGKANKELTGLTYTIQPTLAINANSVDDKGYTWTTFCLNKDFTLEDGYTPYIVRDNGEGGIKLVELLGTPIVDNYDVPFTTIGDVAAADHTASNITHANIDDKYEITYSMSSLDRWNSWNGFDYIDVNYSTKFNVRVLDPAYTPSEILPFIYDCGSYVDSGNYSVSQTADDSFTLEVTGQTVGGLRFAVATGTYNTPIVPANTGILVKGAAKSGIQYTPASGTKADVSGNLLWGCTQSQTKVVGADKYIYKLAWASSAYDNFGFYWGSDDGHSVNANAGKAYLILDDDQSAGSNRMLIFGGDEGTLTDIDAVESVVADVPVFNLQGKRMPNTEHLPAGVYVKNGRKFIVK